jgi:hypothetical protein
VISDRQTDDDELPRVPQRVKFFRGAWREREDDLRSADRFIAIDMAAAAQTSL